jgi:hypothetical protein
VFALHSIPFAPAAREIQGFLFPLSIETCFAPSSPHLVSPTSAVRVALVPALLLLSVIVAHLAAASVHAAAVRATLPLINALQCSAAPSVAPPLTAPLTHRHSRCATRRRDHRSGAQTRRQTQQKHAHWRREIPARRAVDRCTAVQFSRWRAPHCLFMCVAAYSASAAVLPATTVTAADSCIASHARPCDVLLAAPLVAGIAAHVDAVV